MQVTAIKNIGSEIVNAVNNRKNVIAEIDNINKELDYIIYAFISGIYDNEITIEKVYLLELRIRKIDKSGLTDKDKTKYNKLNYKKEQFILNNLTN